MAKGYWVSVYRTISDPEKLAAYNKLAGQAVPQVDDLAAGAGVTVVLSTFLFMLAHTLWLAAILAGLAYAWLYRRTGRLWVPVVAHAVTNGVLGAWVIATGQWAFW